MTTPQPASRVYVTRKGAENHAAREQAYSDRQNDGLVWEAKPVDGGFQVFCTDTVVSAPCKVCKITHSSSYQH